MEKKLRKPVAWLLTLALIISMAPGTVLAAEADTGLCDHHTAHTAECHYAEAVAGTPCGHEHTAECYTAGVLPDGDSFDVYATGEDTNALNCQHQHDDTCGYIAAVEAHPCHYECAVCAAQELIDALPDEVTAENADTVAAHLDAIDFAKAELTADELALLDLSKYTAAAQALGALAAAEVTCTCETKCAEDAINADCPVCAAEGADLTACTGEETAPVCDCGTDDAAIHATNCPAYVAPENPECYCAEKCTEDNVNIWCDVCGVQGVAACKGADEAAVYESYNLWVGGQQVTSENLTIFDDNGGTANYEPTTNTLTLTNYTYAGPGKDSGGAAIWYEINEPLNLVLVGTSSVTQQGTPDIQTTTGLWTTNSGITVSGSGSLTVKGGEAVSQSTGVYAGGSITVSDGASLTAEGGTAGYSCGVNTPDSVTVSGSGKLTAIGGTATDATEYDSCGVYGSVTVSDNGSLKATGGTTAPNGKSYGVYAKECGPIIVSGGTVEAQGNDGAFDVVPTIAETHAVYDVSGAVIETPVWTDLTYAKIAEKPTGYLVTISASENGTVTADKKYADENDTVTLTVTPDEGYVLDILTVNDGAVEVTKAGDTTYSFTMPAEAVTVSAAFTACGHETFAAGICTTCGAVCEHSSYDNGFCTVCDAYQSAALNGRYYEIYNAGQLYWFADKVNSGENNINGMLMENIVVNEGVMTAESTHARVWIPIGTALANSFRGIFDGNSKTISGLYVPDGEFAGMFGCSDNGGQVLRLGVVNSYICGTGYVGGVVGCKGTGYVVLCYNTGTVTGTGHVGGVVGHSTHLIVNCYNTGTVTGTGTDSTAGGVVGFNDAPCGDCYNTGTVNGDGKVGGVAGENTESFGEVSGCYYLTGTAAGGINGADVEGQAEARTAEQFASGEVAYILGNQFPNVLSWGQRIGTDASPVLGGPKVYYGYLSCGDDAQMVYTNDANANPEKPEHGEEPAYQDNGDGNHTAAWSCCGATVTESHTIDPTTGKCVCGVEAQAKIGDTFYLTLAEAAAEVTEGGTIHVLTNVTIGTEETVTFANFATLDVAEGKTITPEKILVKIGTGEDAKDGIIFENKLYYLGTLCEAPSGNNGDIVGINLDTATPKTYHPAGDGYAIYEGNGILRLHNAVITTPDFPETVSGTHWRYAIYSSGKLTIDFSGNNRLTSGNADAHNAGIFVEDDLILTAVGENAALTVQCGSSGYGNPSGIEANSLTVNGGTVTAIGGSTDGTFSCGINVETNLIVKSGTVYARASNSSMLSLGVFAGYETGTITVADGAALYATGGEGTMSAGVMEGTVSGNVNALGLAMSETEDTVTMDYTVYGEVVLDKNVTISNPYAGTEAEDQVTITFTVPAGTTLTVNEGVTLDLSALEAGNIDFSGTVINKGTIKLPAGFDWPHESITGGTVTIGEDSYTWNGEKWVCGEDSHVTELAENKATCERKAVCDLCGASYGDTDSNNHTVGCTLSYEVTEEGKHTGIYSLCNATFTEPHNHTNGKCVCGAKATPDYTVPTNLTATYGNTLADVTLPNGFSWQDNTMPTVGNAGSNTFKVTYTPDDTDNYKVVTDIEVIIQVAKVTLTVKADNKTMTTGQTLPTLTYTITGFVSGETEAVLTTKPTASTSADGQTKGEYEITVSGAAADNYDFTYENGTLFVVDHQHAWTYTADGDTITATCGNADTCPVKTANIKIAAVGKTYDGTPVTATLTGSIEGVDNPAITCSGNTNVGTYTASITLDKAEATVSFEIKAATPVITWASGSEAVDYTGEKATITAPTVTLVNSETFVGTISYSYTGTSSGSGLPINAGTYKITASIAAQGNYTEATSSETLSLTINKVASSCTTPVAVSGLTFNGGNQNLVTAGTATGGTMQYSLDNSNWSATIPTGKDAGSYTVYYKVVGDSNHNNKAGGSVPVTIAPKGVTAPTIEGIEAQYLHTGSAITPVPTAVKDGNAVINPSEYTVAYDNNTNEGTATLKIVDKDGGNYTVNGSRTFAIVKHVHVWTYTVSGGTITATCSGTIGTCPVENKTVTLNLNAPAELTYDGAEKTVTVTQSPSGIFGDVPAVSYTGDRKSVGTHTASLTYGGKTASVSFTIVKADQTAPAGLNKTDETLKGQKNGAITGVTNKMEYATTSGGSYTAITGTTLDNLAAGTYYVRFAADANHNASPDTTVTIAVGAAITVTYNQGTQAASGMPAQLTDLSYGAKLTKPADPTPSNNDYAFVGWYKDAAGNTAWDFATDTLIAENVTLYAKWKQVYFSVTAAIKDHEGNEYHGTVEVDLMRGNNLIDSVTGTSGSFTFSKHVEAGMYNLVAIYTDDAGDEHTKTELITVDHDGSYVLRLPAPGVNSHLDVSSNAETPAVMVGGLDDEAESVKSAEDQASGSNPVKEVSVTMGVEGKKENQVNDEVVRKIEEAIAEDPGSEVSAVVEYLEIEVKKEVVTDSGTTTTPITQTTNVIEIVIPFNFSGRTGIKIIRHHGDAAEALVQNNTKGNGTFYLDIENGYIHIFTNLFSTYAVSYTTSYNVTFDMNGGDGSNSNASTNADGTVVLPSDPTRSGYTFKGWYTASSGGTKVTSDYVFSGDTTVYAQWAQNYTPPAGGGGTVTVSYTVTVEDSTNGTVRADRTRTSSGTTVTLTVTPDTGYTLETLTVMTNSGREIELTNKGNGKYTFKMPSSKVTVKATFMDDNTMLNFFVDVPADAYYYDAVLWAAENGITSGTTATTFSPNNPCTRAQMATFLWRAAGSPDPVGKSHPFTDIPADAYYAKAVQWAYEQGITGGTSATTFSPDDTCTRGQMATFLWRNAGSKAPVSNENQFADVPAEKYYAVAVQWAYEQKITSGTSATTYSPDDPCTRAQMVTFLCRFFVK